MFLVNHNRIRGVFLSIGDAAGFAARSLWQALRPPLELAEIGRQIYEVGYRSLPLIAAAGFAVGAVMSMHTRASLERFGAESLIPIGLGIAIIKETGPLVAALLFSGRVGAGIGAELGAMRVSEQIDALESLAVDSFKHLVVTRVLACMIALPLLTTVMNFTGIFGGYVAETVISGMTFDLYFDRALSAIEFQDYLPATGKTIVFGFIIGAVSSYFGYFTRGGTAGVGQASTRSVVFSSILVILSNVILVKTIFFFFPGAGQ
ncbi:MAG: ABC transporter permease [Acidobacteria bacterium]|nr:ABC transporter permease [Acidobacteriota bacterium]